MTENRVLSLDEALALEEGREVWVEADRFTSGIYSLRRDYYDPHHKLTLGVALVTNEDFSYTLDGKYGDDYGVWFRVWSLPQEPTPEELAANPWTGGGTDDERA